MNGEYRHVRDRCKMFVTILDKISNLIHVWVLANPKKQQQKIPR